MIKQGVYKDLSNNGYHGDINSYSKSNLSDFAVSPLRMRAKRKIKAKPKKEYDIGTAIHAAILEPHLFDKQIAVVPSGMTRRKGIKKKTPWDLFREQNAGKVFISQADYDVTRRAADSVLRRNDRVEVRRLLTGGIAETSFFLKTRHKYDYMLDRYYMYDDGTLPVKDHEGTVDIMLKCRPDYLPGGRVIVDLKTSRDISPKSFGRDAYRYKYHWSAALSCMILSALTGKHHNRYIFVCVEKEPPFDCVAYETPEWIINNALEEIVNVFSGLAECIANDTWPGMPDDILPLEWPNWG